MWTGTQFVAVGEAATIITSAGGIMAMSSPDGVTWTNMAANRPASEHAGRKVKRKLSKRK